jgi:hypothetical protein
MAWFRKNSDPLSDRARALNHEIADLEAQIKKLDARLQENQSEPSESQPRLRSTAIPHGATVSHEMHDPMEPAPVPKAHEPIFEDVDVDRLNDKGEPITTPMHYNELGMRKYDLPALFRRVRDQFHRPSTTNPRLVSYLAAGGIQGLRPMRHEKRVARYRFYILVAVLFLSLLGIILLFRHH